MNRRTFISLSTMLPFFGITNLISCFSKESITNQNLKIDPNSIIDLHPSLQYRIISEKDLMMSDGFKVPGLADGMGSFLVDNNILQLPDYIKIDVDGVEHFILEGSLRTLKNKKIKSILIELNEDFKEQFKTCNKILKDSGFKLLKKEHSQMFENSIYSNVYNYIFTR